MFPNQSPRRFSSPYRHDYNRSMETSYAHSRGPSPRTPQQYFTASGMAPNFTPGSPRLRSSTPRNFQPNYSNDNFYAHSPNSDRSRSHFSSPPSYTPPYQSYTPSPVHLQRPGNSNSFARPRFSHGNRSIRKFENEASIEAYFSEEMLTDPWSNLQPVLVDRPSFTSV